MSELAERITVQLFEIVGPHQHVSAITMTFPPEGLICVACTLPIRDGQAILHYNGGRPCAISQEPVAHVECAWHAATGIPVRGMPTGHTYQVNDMLYERARNDLASKAAGL